MSKSINPINRINRFFSQEDFSLEINMGRESLSDGNFTVILYRVNRELTESNNVYGEASKDGIRYYPPIELRVVPIISEAENKSYNKDGGLRYMQDGKLTFGIYDDELSDLDTSISYGDYIGYAINETDIRYFTVVNDGTKNWDNKHTIMGYRSAFRTITCASVDSSEFSAK